MIASPSDVPSERQIIRDVIHEWNAIHSENTKIVLMPIGWETHASPQMGLRPQEVINKQVLKECDLLVAAFWTRVGSPTGKSLSGSIEEIEEHLSSGKPAMIYFSSEPVRQDSVDNKQYKSLKTFENSCLERGLVEVYDSKTEFREKFVRHLAQTIIREFIVEADQDATEINQNSNLQSQKPVIPELSEYARLLLIEASQDDDGTILKLRTFDGLHVQTNGKEFSSNSGPRDEARLEEAIDQLQTRSLIKDKGYKGEVFSITEVGYQVADALKEIT